MEFLAGLSFLVWVAVLGVPISMAVLAWSAYYRVKGIERALWAVVSQLQALRHGEHDPVQAALTRSGREVPAPTGMISTSIFGR